MTELAEKASEALAKRAITERGVRIRYAEDEVDAALRLLVLNGGSYKQTVEQLLSENLQITREQLRYWRDSAFPRRYFQIRQELGRDVGEEIAGRALERAIQADEAEQRYIEVAMQKVDQVDPDHLAKNALALANAKSHSIEKSELLRGRPTERVEVDVEASVQVLERLGVVEKAIEAEVVEEEDVANG